MTIDQKLDLILNKLEGHDKKFDAIEDRIDRYEYNMSNDIYFKVKISEIHEYSDLLNSLNSAFIRYESETSDKFKTLFDTRKDFLEHKNLFLHELAKLEKNCS